MTEPRATCARCCFFRPESRDRRTASGGVCLLDSLRHAAVDRCDQFVAHSEPPPKVTGEIELQTQLL